MRITIQPNLQKNNALECAKKVCEILFSDGVEIIISPKFYNEFKDLKGIEYLVLSEAVKKSDFVIAIGGDGTMLRCAKKIIGTNAKLIGINTGRLGFMASLEADQIEKLLLLKTGDYEIIERMLIRGIVHSEDKKTEFNALNEINIKGLNSKICDFEIYSEDYQIGNYRADGVLFSTPTGSTAYSLSAGGPIIEPDLECIEMTLICPHSLFSRTMLFSPNRKLKLICTSIDDNNLVDIIFDGEEPLKLHRNDYLEILKSDYKIPFVDFYSRNNFHESLSKKLMQSIK